MRHLWESFAVLLVLSGANSNLQIPSAKDSEVLDQVREAAFRHYMPTGKNGYNQTVVCLQADKELSDQFLKRLTLAKAKVVRVSDCDVDASVGVHLKGQKEQGVLITIEGMKWLSGTEAEVKGSQYWDGLAANFSTLRVVYRKGRWVVKSEKITAVS